MKPADAYFFDIDGTLLVTRDLVHWNALQRAMLEVYGVDTTIAELPYQGKTDVAILRAALHRRGVTRQAFDNRLPSALAVVCREVEKNAAAISAEVCPAVPYVLSRILEEGKLLAVASGNLEAVGWHKLSAAGLRTFFGFGSFGDHSEQRVAIFDHGVRLAKDRLGNAVKVCFIGDTPDDIRAARSVHASIVAVSTGTFSFEELARMEPDACCQSCAELLGPF